MARRPADKALTWSTSSPCPGCHRDVAWPCSRLGWPQTLHKRPHPPWHTRERVCTAEPSASHCRVAAPGQHSPQSSLVAPVQARCRREYAPRCQGSPETAIFSHARARDVQSALVEGHCAHHRVGGQRRGKLGNRASQWGSTSAPRNTHEAHGPSTLSHTVAPQAHTITLAAHTHTHQAHTSSTWDKSASS